jgi:hypothetical protein
MSTDPNGDGSAARDERAHRDAQIVRDRLAGGAPEDDPITRAAIDDLNRELTEMAEGRRQAPAKSPRPRRR